MKTLTMEPDMTGNHGMLAAVLSDKSLVIADQTTTYCIVVASIGNTIIYRMPTSFGEMIY